MTSTPDSAASAYSYLLNLISREVDADNLFHIFNALLTEKEKKEIANRVHIFANLQDGLTQREISEKLGVGIATVSRGAKAYKEFNIDLLLPDISQQLR